MSKKAPLTVNPVPTQKQIKDWHSRIAEYGCVITGERCRVQLHHVVGRTKRVSMGIGKYHIGKWFVIPLVDDLHDVGSPNPTNVTHYPKRFVREYGRQCDLFQSMCRVLAMDGPLPFDEDVLQAILSTGI